MTPDEQAARAERIAMPDRLAAETRARERLAEQRVGVGDLRTDLRALMRQLRAQDHPGLADELDALLEPLRFGGREARVLARLERIAQGLSPELAATTRGLAERVRITLQ